MAIDIDPSNLASRILEVREQIAGEWQKDLDVLVAANDQIENDVSEDILDDDKDIDECFRENELQFLADEAQKLKNELDILREKADKVDKHEATIESFKKKLETFWTL